MSVCRSKGASRSRARIGSPLNALRVQAGLTVAQLACRFGVSTATVSRWLTGARGAPEPFVLALQMAAAGDTTETARAQAKYRAARARRQQARPTITLVLPPGLDAKQAQRVCTDALSSLLDRPAAVR